MNYLIDPGGISSAYWGDYMLLITAFALIGFGLKYIDDVFDEGLFNKDVAKLMAPILVAIWVCLSILDSISATILFSILFAVLLAGKVDNLVFKLSSIALIVIFLLAMASQLSLAPFFALTVMGVVDEKGNDYVDSHKIGEVREFFFAHRCGMKLSILGLCVVSLFPWVYLLAFLAFDTAYEFVDACSYQSVPSFSARIERLQLG